jgi:thiamine biosynthesis protein ThiS
MRLWVNGKPVEAPEGTTVRALLDQVHAEVGRVAVERNQDVVPRKSWSEVALTDGDHIEIVSFVGGG